jgi:hypothetical protein
MNRDVAARWRMGGDGVALTKSPKVGREARS